MFTLFSDAGPQSQAVWPDLAENPHAFAGLATSLPEEHDYMPRVEGRLPEDLEGSLYRNGPGLFDRGGKRKRMLLDGDGMIQAFDFSQGRVRFRNRFVATPKYLDEKAADAFLYGTWSTMAPGGPLANALMRKMRSQAGVSVMRRGEKLYAFDESTLPVELDPVTLDTRGPSALGLEEGASTYAAHYKIDGRNGDWLNFGVEYGRVAKIHVTIFDRTGALKSHRVIPMPRMLYLHDWLVSERHLIFVLHPAEITSNGLLGMMAGIHPLADAIHWNPKAANLIMVVSRESNAAPRFFEAAPTMMWHALNAFEADGTIIADLISAPLPAGPILAGSAAFEVMQGKQPSELPAPNFLRRYEIDLERNTLHESVLASEDSYELPFVNPHHACHRHRFGYMTRKGQAPSMFSSSVARVDTVSGEVATFDFGAGKFCGEPVFVPKPDMVYDPVAPHEPGYLLTEVYDGHAKKSFLAVLLADRLQEGPVATVHLNHHVPVNFHGYWHPAT